MNSCYFRAGEKVGNWVYYSAEDRNALYRVNFDTDEVEILGVFPDNTTHVKCGQVGDELWFAPICGFFFDIYNIITGKMRRQYIKCVDGYEAIGNSFRIVAFLHDRGKSFIIPNCYPYIIIVDESDYHLEYFDIPNEFLEEGLYDNLFKDGLIFERWCYLCPDANKYLIRVDICSFKVQAIKWDETSYAYGKLVAKDDCIYVIPVKSNVEIIRLSKDFKSYEKIGILLDFDNEFYQMIVGMINEELWFFGMDTNRIVKLPISTWKPEYLKRPKNVSVGYFGVIENDDALIFSGRTKGDDIAWINSDGILEYKGVSMGTKGEIEYILYCMENQ